MTSAGRCDVFLRGVHEPFSEIEQREKTHPNLIVDESFMIVYKFPMFFFTRQGDIRLANAIEKGFKAAYDDGSFELFFSVHPKIKSVAEEANMNSRSCLEIPNPLLTEETKSVDDKYWGGLNFDGSSQKGC